MFSLFGLGFKNRDTHRACVEWGYPSSLFNFPSAVKIKPFTLCYECAVEEISGNQTEQECSTKKMG
jgi:hypothetical protein